MFKYGAAESNLTVFGIPIDDFGTSDPAVTIEEIEDRGALQRGLGGTTIRLDNKTLPMRLTVNLMAGSAQARQIIAAAKSGVDATFTFIQSGTGERHVGFDGMLQSRGPRNRVGKTENSISDEQFVFVFGDGEET